MTARSRPRDWVTISTVEAHPRNGNGNGHHADPLQEMRRGRDQRLIQEIADQELQEFKEKADLESLKRQADRVRLERIINPPEAGRASDEGARAMAEVVSGLMKQVTDLQGQLIAQQQAMAKSEREAMREQLAQLGKQLDRVQGQAAPDPIAHLVTAAEQITKVQDVLRASLPQPPPAVSERMTRREMLEEERIREEAELRRMEFKLRLTESTEERERLRRQLDMQQGKVDRLAGTLGQAMELAANVLGPKVAGLVSGEAGVAAGADRTVVVVNARRPWTSAACPRRPVVERRACLGNRHG